MKHILICLLCTVILFSYVEKNTVAKSDITAANANDVVTKVAAAATTQTKKEAAPPKNTQMQVGILLGRADDLGTARFKNTFEKGLSQDVKINSVDTSGKEETQKTMFDKVLESGYNLVVLEMMEDSPAEYFIDKAGSAGVPMIIIGVEPKPELMARYAGIYYMGFSNENMMDMMAAETVNFWNNNPKMMNFEKDDWDLTYSAITSAGFVDSGSRTAFEAAMEKLKVSTSMAVDSVVRHYDYDLHKEIDQTIIDDSEIVFYDSSVEAQKAINYFNDPTEFKKRPKQQLALSVIDDGAIQLVNNRDVLFACGTDTKLLGVRAASMAQLLMAGQVPSFQNLEMEPTNQRCFYLPATVIRADIPPEPTNPESNPE